ncbi:MAG: XRE family transcriptional regulator [bacterium]|nr:XRE family transcriptional regulator [bacterium]
MNKKLKLKIVEKFGSQAEFSIRVPEDESMISRVILGRRRLSPERQRAWAEVLRCKAQDLFD